MKRPWSQQRDLAATSSRCPFVPLRAKTRSQDNGYRRCILQPLPSQVKNCPVVPSAARPLPRCPRRAAPRVPTLLGPVPKHRPPSRPRLSLLSSSIILCNFISPHSAATREGLLSTSSTRRKTVQRPGPSVYFFPPQPVWRMTSLKILGKPRHGKADGLSAEEDLGAIHQPVALCHQPGESRDLSNKCHVAMESKTGWNPIMLLLENRVTRKQQQVLFSPSFRRSSPSWCSAPS